MVVKNLVRQQTAESSRSKKHGKRLPRLSGFTLDSQTHSVFPSHFKETNRNHKSMRVAGKCLVNNATYCTITGSVRAPSQSDYMGHMTYSMYTYAQQTSCNKGLCVGSCQTKQTINTCMSLHAGKLDVCGCQGDKHCE
jgi:hypothetical protein